MHIECYFRQKSSVELLHKKLRADITMIAEEIRRYLSGDVECPKWRFESLTALHGTVR